MVARTNVTYEELKELYIALITYVCPGNPNGFFIEFCRWVTNTWGNGKYYEIENLIRDHDESTQPQKTNLSLREAVNTYHDFINSANGHTEPTYNAGSGLCATCREDDLSDFYAQCCLSFIERWFAEKKPSLSKVDIEEEILRRIYTESFNDKAMNDMASNINSDFCYGLSKLEPYHCCIVGVKDKEYIYSHCIFAKWTLNDFIKIVTD